MKPLTFAVLRLLADGEFHSGEKLARELDISRASVWNALKEADQLGVALYKIRGRGYRLVQPPQWLDREKITAALGTQANRFSIEIVDQIESTNTRLLQKAAEGAPKGRVVAAEWQARGRGRRGRSWHMNLGGGLTFSVLWRFEQGAGFLSGLSLAVGVALARALKTMGAEEIALKWPNDVLHHHHKLAGILIEVQGDVLGPSIAVIGIGINLRLSETVRSSIDQAVTDMYSATRIVPDRNRVLGSVLSHLAQVLDFFEARGFAGVREEWSNLHAYHRKHVLVILPNGGVEEGIVIGVDDNGSLLLLAGGGEHRYTSGEISLRGQTV